MKILVTPHAVEKYIERVCSLVSAERAEHEIIEALQRPLFHCPRDKELQTLWGCVNLAGYPFLISTDPADENAPFLLVRTVGLYWYWHEARNYWKEFNRGSKHHWKFDRVRIAASLRGEVRSYPEPAAARHTATATRRPDSRL